MSRYLRLVLLILAVQGALTALWLWNDSGKAPIWFCRVACGMGVCPPCPGDPEPTPVGRTMIAIPARPRAPQGPTPSGDL